MPAFSKEAYEAYDSKAKTTVRAHLDSKRIFTNVYEDYGPDILAFHEFFHEVEIKTGWKDEWPEHWEPCTYRQGKRNTLMAEERAIFGC